MSNPENNSPDFNSESWRDFDTTVPDEIPDWMTASLEGEINSDTFLSTAATTELPTNEWNKQCIDTTIAAIRQADKEVQNAASIPKIRQPDYHTAAMQEAARGQVSTTRRMVGKYDGVEKVTDEQLREAHRIRLMVFAHSGIDPTDAESMYRIMGTFVRTGNNSHEWEELDTVAARSLEQDDSEFVRKLNLSVPLCSQRMYDSSDAECARLWSIARITRFQFVAYQKYTQERELWKMLQEEA